LRPKAPSATARMSATLSLPHGQDVQPQQHRPEPVLFAHMVGPGAEAFLAADRGAAGVQQVAEELPPGRRLEVADPQRMRPPGRRRRGRHRPRDPLASPPCIAGRQRGIRRQHGKAVGGRDVDAAPDHHVAVAVAVRRRAEIGGVGAQHLVHQRLGPGGDRRRGWWCRSCRGRCRGIRRSCRS
jgi:hypothetical protein